MQRKCIFCKEMKFLFEKNSNRVRNGTTCDWRCLNRSWRNGLIEVTFLHEYNYTKDVNT